VGCGHVNTQSFKSVISPVSGAEMISRGSKSPTPPIHHRMIAPSLLNAPYDIYD
jgi:hypothetical protein